MTGDTQAPSTPSNLNGAGSLSSVALTWSGSTDNVGVTRYNLHRGTTAGFTPSAANRIAQPTGTAYTDTGLAAGTYYYRVTAEDAAGNISALSNEASAVVTGDVAARRRRDRCPRPAVSSVGLTWTAATDNVAVSPLQRPPVDDRRVHAERREPDRTADLTELHRRPLAAATYYYRVTAEDAAGNVGAAVHAGHRQPSPATSRRPRHRAVSPRRAARRSVALTWTAATDNVGVTRYNVHRSTTNGFTPSVANRIAQPTGTSYTDSRSPPAPTTTASPPRTRPATSARVSPRRPARAPQHRPPASSRPTRWTRDPARRRSDKAGTNTGTISGATWAPAGRFGGALSFDGTNDIVNVPDASALDLTTAMTLEAWVRPTALGDRLAHRRPQGAARQLRLRAVREHRHEPAERERRHRRRRPRPFAARSALSLNTWTHLATTYDGANLRLYVDGALVGARRRPPARSRPRPESSASAATTIWGEYFAGLIDEIRIYNRALTQAEIQTDMTRASARPTPTAPSAPATPERDRLDRRRSRSPGARRPTTSA